MRKPVTPGQRKRRLVRDALILLFCLAVLVVAEDFPIPTAELALEATQRQNFFGPGQVVDILDYVGDRPVNTYWGGKYDRYYILQDGGWYAWCGVNHYGWSWQTGGLAAVENDPSVPMVPLVICDWPDGAVLVICNDPEIARVEVLFPVYSPSAWDGWTIFSATGEEQVEGCFVVEFHTEEWPYPERNVVRGYNAAGELVYQSSIPEDWWGMGKVVELPDGTVTFEGVQSAGR